MFCLDKNAMLSLRVTATASAAYLDICDAGASGGRPDAGYYRLCGDLLTKIFTLVDAARHFPELLKTSPAAAEIADGIRLARRIEAGASDIPPEVARCWRQKKTA